MVKPAGSQERAKILAKPEPIIVRILQGTRLIKEIELPTHGELKLVTHDGTIRTFETTTKEKLS